MNIREWASADGKRRAARLSGEGPEWWLFGLRAGKWKRDAIVRTWQEAAEWIGSRVVSEAQERQIEALCREVDERAAGHFAPVVAGGSADFRAGALMGRSRAVAKLRAVLLERIAQTGELLP